MIAPEVVIIEWNQAFTHWHNTRTRGIERDRGYLPAIGAGCAQSLLHGRDQRFHVIGVLLGGVIGVFFLKDERVFRDTRAQPSLQMIEDRNTYAECSEINARNDARMRHDILLSKHKQRMPRRDRYQLFSMA